jgi:hypothetical protein
MKKILFIILIISNWNLSSQEKGNLFKKVPFKKVEILLKNGDTLKGIGKINTFNEIIYKKNKKSSKSTYNYKTIKEIIIYTKEIPKKYLYKVSQGRIIDNKTRVKIHLLEPLMLNKVSIYLETVIGSNNSGSLTFPSSINNTRPIFYISKSNSHMVTLLEPNSYTSPSSKNPYYIKKKYIYNPFKKEFYETPEFILNDLNINPKTRYFKKIANQYFSDCKELMNKIESNSFDKYSFLSILNYYNNECK